MGCDTTPIRLARHETKLYSKCLNDTQEEVVEYMFESLHIVGSLLFVVGSIYFYPANDPLESTRKLRFGCRFFDAGSIIYAILYTYMVVEKSWISRSKERRREMRRVERLARGGVRTSHIRKAGAMKPKSRRRCCCFGCNRCCCVGMSRGCAEQIMYLLGSLVFLVGTLIWDPDISEALHLGDWWDVAAIVLFALGSFMFTLAAFINAMGISQSHPGFRGYSLFSALCVEFGGLLFVVGTVGFVPGILNGTGEICTWDMAAMGAICYGAGSLLYVVSAVIKLLKTMALNQLAREEASAALLIQERIRCLIIAPREDAAREIQDMVKGHLGKKSNTATVLHQVVRQRTAAKKTERREAAERIQRLWAEKQVADVDTDLGLTASEAAHSVQELWAATFQQRMDAEDAADDAEEMEVQAASMRVLEHKLLRRVNRATSRVEDGETTGSDSNDSNDSNDSSDDTGSADGDSSFDISRCQERKEGTLPAVPAAPTPAHDRHVIHAARQSRQHRKDAKRNKGILTTAVRGLHFLWNTMHRRYYNGHRRYHAHEGALEDSRAQPLLREGDLECPVSILLVLIHMQHGGAWGLCLRFAKRRLPEGRPKVAKRRPATYCALDAATSNLFAC